jgi:hypothetical protein
MVIQEKSRGSFPYRKGQEKEVRRYGKRKYK